MARDPNQTFIYHITDVSNLASIIASGGIFSDASMMTAGANPTIIGYPHINNRRLKEYRVPCCGHKFVGEFVPFYFCPRSPMLYTINRGNVNGLTGGQKSIIHFVSTAGLGMNLGRQWAISDGNAGAAYTEFSSAPEDLNNLGWDIIDSNNWSGERLHKKQSEFLVADFFPLSSMLQITCHNDVVAAEVRRLTQNLPSAPRIETKLSWYY